VQLLRRQMAQTTKVPLPGSTSDSQSSLDSLDSQRQSEASPRLAGRSVPLGDRDQRCAGAACGPTRAVARQESEYLKKRVRDLDEVRLCDGPARPLEFSEPSLLYNFGGLQSGSRNEVRLSPHASY
jgi:hypothetical protein